MTASDSVQFKVSLSRPNHPEEIRRFTIEKDVVTNYGYLRQKLYSIFPILQSTGMTVSWRDSDGDMVTIGSDEELIIALTEMEGDCKKLKCVTPGPGVAHVPTGTGAAGPRPENYPKVIHDRVTCDGCDSFVTGYRYKCMVCPDFDLCFDCEQKGFHPEHVMIRYPFPLAKSRDHHFVKKLKKLHKKFDHHNQMFCEPDFLGHDHRKSFKGTRGNRCPVVNRDVLDLVDDFVSSLRAQVIEVTPEIIQEVIDSLSVLNMSETNGSNPTAAAPDTPSNSKKQGESSKKRDKEDRSNKKRGCPFSEPRPEMSARSGSMSAAHPPLANLISSVMQQVGTVAPHVVPNILSALNQMGAAVNTTAASAAASVPAAATPTSSTEPVKPSTSGTQTVPSAPAGNSSSEPMVVTLDDDSQPPTASPALPQAAKPDPPSSNQSTDVPAAVSEPPSSEFNQMVDRQLQTMLNMGFNNEGGWLRELLVAKGGDISQVLDHLGGIASKESRSYPLQFD